MLITRPAYYDRFRCAAADCPDSCCKGWQIQVDAASAARYQALPGDLGRQLRQVLRTDGEETVMTIRDGRCPMWRSDGLCRIQAELGEQALCRVCREFPRLTHDYGDLVELGLELSCPEAAKLILNAAPGPALTENRPGGKADDPALLAALRASRETALTLLADESRPVGQTLALILLWACQVQTQLDGGPAGPFDPETALEEARALAKPGDAAAIVDFFAGLELLTPEWAARLRAPAPAPWEGRFLALARYLVQRYWLQAVSDGDLYSRAKLIVVSCLLVKTLGGELVSTAQLFSKEIENDADNVEALLEGAYTAPAFRDDRLLGLLLE